MLDGCMSMVLDPVPSQLHYNAPAGVRGMPVIGTDSTNQLAPVENSA